MVMRARWRFREGGAACTQIAEGIGTKQCAHRHAGRALEELGFLGPRGTVSDPR